MPKTTKMGITPIDTASSASVPAPEIEQPKYTAAMLIVAKAGAFDAEMNYQIALAGRQKSLIQVQEIATYLQQYASRNSLPTGKPE